jgi:hypothetical protein
VRSSSIKRGCLTVCEINAIRDRALFNVPAEASEVIIPIQTAIPVRLAKAFAITDEQAGGVVVPDKVHLVALGTAG